MGSLKCVDARVECDNTWFSETNNAPEGKTMATAYEWVVEEMDGEDVEDTHCFDSLKEAKAAFEPGNCLALRKLKSNRDGDSVHLFAYAYMDSGELPAEFDDGSAVPARYLSEASS